jgi:hypothetical protein
MIGISGFALFLALGAAMSFVLSLLYPTRSRLRQALMLAAYAVVGGGAVFYLIEREGISHLLEPAWRDYVIVGVLCFAGVGIMALTFDLYVNFDALKDDPSYAMLGRPGLAAGMVALAVTAMMAISFAWYQLDPTILETRSNIVSWRETGQEGLLKPMDFLVFALDQAQKALLFDVSEVYRIGLIDIGNNPSHVAFSTACLVYRTFLSVFVITIAARLLR